MNTATDIPRTMRASVLVAQGQVRDDERPVPIPADDEVLIKVASVGVCGSDVHYYREGRIGDFVVDAPLVLGHEAVRPHRRRRGRSVPDSRIGERVAIEPQRPCRRLPPVRRGPLQPLPVHGVLRHSADRRRLLRVRDDPGALRAPGPRLHHRRRRRPARAALRRHLGQPQGRGRPRVAGADRRGRADRRDRRAGRAGLRRGRGHRHRPGGRAARDGRAVRRDDHARPDDPSGRRPRRRRLHRLLRRGSRRQVGHRGGARRGHRRAGRDGRGRDRHCRSR